MFLATRSHRGKMYVGSMRLCQTFTEAIVHLKNDSRSSYACCGWCIYEIKEDGTLDKRISEKIIKEELKKVEHETSK